MLTLRNPDYWLLFFSYLLFKLFNCVSLFPLFSAIHAFIFVFTLPCLMLSSVYLLFIFYFCKALWMAYVAGILVWLWIKFASATKRPGVRIVNTPVFKLYFIRAGVCNTCLLSYTWGHRNKWRQLTIWSLIKLAWDCGVLTSIAD